MNRFPGQPRVGDDKRALLSVIISLAYQLPLSVVVVAVMEMVVESFEQATKIMVLKMEKLLKVDFG